MSIICITRQECHLVKWNNIKQDIDVRTFQVIYFHLHISLQCQLSPLEVTNISSSLLQSTIYYSHHSSPVQHHPGLYEKGFNNTMIICCSWGELVILHYKNPDSNLSLTRISLWYCATSCTWGFGGEVVRPLAFHH